MFGLLEWAPLGVRHPLVLGGLTIGGSSLVVLFIVEGRARSPMLPTALFRSRPFTLANLLTLLLYAALSLVLFLAPLNFIQVQHYTATAAGAALLPFPVIMFALSRWSGGLVARIGSRLPLTVGPGIAALGLALYARPGIGGSYWMTFFPAVVMLGLGMIAIFGVLLGRTFETRVRSRVDRLALSSPAREGTDRELRKIAGADLTQVPALTRAEQREVRAIIDEGFVFAFRLVMIAAAGLAIAAAGVGNAIRQDHPNR